MGATVWGATEVVAAAVVGAADAEAAAVGANVMRFAEFESVVATTVLPSTLFDGAGVGVVVTPSVPAICT